MADDLLLLTTGDLLLLTTGDGLLLASSTPTPPPEGDAGADRTDLGDAGTFGTPPGTLGGTF